MTGSGNESEQVKNLTPNREKEVRNSFFWVAPFCEGPPFLSALGSVLHCRLQIYFIIFHNISFLQKLFLFLLSYSVNLSFIWSLFWVQL